MNKPLPHLEPSKNWVLLYSFSQKCFHYETLDETMQSGIRAYVEDKSYQDYILLFVGTRSDVEAVCAQLKKLATKTNQP